MTTVKGAGDTGMRENPPVHSKAGLHGIPRTPGKVSSPGGVASLPHGASSGVAMQKNPSAYPGVRNVPYSNSLVQGGKVSKAPPSQLDQGKYGGGKGGTYGGDK